MLVSFLAAPMVHAQSSYELQTGFVRDVNRYQWLGTFSAIDEWGGWRLRAQNMFVSDAFALFENRYSFRDENRLRLSLERPLSPLMSLQIRGISSVFSQSRVHIHDVIAGIRYRAASALWVEPRAGASWDSRPGAALERASSPVRMDAGPSYGIDFAYTPAGIGEYAVNLRGQSMWQVIAPRRGRMLRLAGTADRTFGETDVALSIDLSSFRRDAYEAVSFLNREASDRLAETIEATRSDTLLAVLHLRRSLAPRLRLSGQLGFDGANRLVRALRTPADALFFDTDFRRRAVDAQVAVEYGTRWAEMSVALTTRAQVERRSLENRDVLPASEATQKTNLLRQADYDRGHLAVHARGRVSHGKLSASFDGTASVLRHDTPAINPDDRDELYNHALIGLMVRFSRYLEADLRFFGTYYHTVYLDALRSAENNVQRSLRLRPTVRWRPTEQTRIELSSEVRATYTVDDFVLAGRRPKDQSARELRYDLTTEHRFGGNFVLRTSGSISDLHLGRLIWDRFAEIPFDTLRTYSGWIRMQTGRTFVADVGLRFFVRSDYGRATLVRYPRIGDDGEPVLDPEGAPIITSISRPGTTWIEQVGPTCAVAWRMQSQSSVRLEGWLNIQRVRQQLYGDLPDASAPIIRRHARRGETQMIPNVSLTVLWHL